MAGGNKGSCVGQANAQRQCWWSFFWLLVIRQIPVSGAIRVRVKLDISEVYACSLQGKLGTEQQYNRKINRKTIDKLS